MKFDYFGYNYITFERAFNKFYNGIIPLVFLTDDFLNCMSVENPYFLMPGAFSKDGRSKRYTFDVKDDVYLFKAVYHA